MITPQKITDGLLLAIDVETTGVDPYSDSIVELGGAYVKAGALFGDTLRSRVNPQRYISAESSRVHGITNEDVERSPPWRVVSKWLQAHVERPKGEARPLLCGYNILGFDAPIINDENKRAELEWRLDEGHILDTYLFCRWFHPEHQSRLGSMCRCYGIELPEDRAHSADADSAATALLTIAMVWAGYIPDDVERALSFQAEVKQKMEADVERYGRGLYVDRSDPERLMIARGVHRGKCLFDMPPTYIQGVVRDWKSSELTDEARALIQERTKRQDELF